MRVRNGSRHCNYRIGTSLPSEGYSLVAKLGMTFTAAILYVELLTRARDPEKRLEDILKKTEYFDPKDIVQKRERVQEPSSSGITS